ncbi:hypothetical protein [Clostridium uliginosum]|uniref:Lipoprotein n=1 Tax=Clostridium uliginosum TaxID=119641 RepID=A0A1I1S4L8_9CLOT|nr:hypothetical protein [Clostridium uliginosum]SFD41461.1 hypothetical protein SAMN05421842_1446 [Clostridium uliginosum]
MKKKLITLLLVVVVSATALISCGGTKKDVTNTTTEQSQTTTETPATTDASNTPTVEVKQVVTIADLKEKNEEAIKTLLGEPKSTDNNKSIYEKDNYNFEITYIDSKSGIVKITPSVDMKYPNDGINILHVLGINAETPDVTAPIGLIWNNKFDTYKIIVASDDKVENKLSYVQIILDEKYNQ